MQEGAFALAFKSVHFPGEIVVARYDILLSACSGDRLVFSCFVSFQENQIIAN